MTKQCEGYRRHGNAFSFGPVTWKRCENNADVELVVVQDEEESTFPACIVCWDEAIGNDKIQVKDAKPLNKGD
jgi:hypothetical protein